MKRLIFAIVLTLAFCASDCFALNLRPYMQTPPEVQVFAKRVIEDGGKVVDLEYCQKYTRLSKQLITWSNGKFVGDANMGVKLNSGVSVQTLYDLSGNNNDATQATEDNQPVWTAGVQGGRYGLRFDGSNDALGVPGTKAQPLTVVVGVLQRTWTDLGNKYFLGISGGAFKFGQEYATSSPRISIYAGTAEISSDALALNVFGTVTGVYNGASSELFVNGISRATGNIGATGIIDQLYIGGVDPSGEAPISILFSFIFSTVLSTAQRTALETFSNAYYAIY